MSCYLSGIAQISIQEPLSDNWFTRPVLYNTSYRQAVEADYKAFIPPMVARRMGVLVRRAIATSVTALHQAGLTCPEAIVTGTGLGCIDNTEKFLSAMVMQGESMLQPTFFINSTHNTISSQIAIHLGCHGYNNTFAHLGVSFENALLDAVMQLQLEGLQSALVGGHDEMTPAYFGMLQRIGYWKPDADQQQLREAVTPGSMAGETAVSAVLTTTQLPSSIARLDDVVLLYRPDRSRMEQAVTAMLQQHAMKLTDIDLIVTGKNGDRNHDLMCDAICDRLTGKNVPRLWYKHIFGESYTASAFGMYTGALCLRNRTIPPHFVYHAGSRPASAPLRHVLCMQNFQNKDYAFILLSAC